MPDSVLRADVPERGSRFCHEATTRGTEVGWLDTDGDPVGVWRFAFADGRQCLRAFRDDGTEFVMWMRPDGTCRSMGEVVEGAKHGTWWYVDAHRRIEAWEVYSHGARVGLYAYYAEDGSVVHDGWSRRGYCLTFDPDGALVALRRCEMDDDGVLRFTGFAAIASRDRTYVACGRLHDGEKVGRWFVDSPEDGLWRPAGHYQPAPSAPEDPRYRRYLEGLL